MKKVIALLAVLTLSFSLMGCQSAEAKKPAEVKEAEVVTESATEVTQPVEEEKEEVAIQPAIKIKRDILPNVPNLLKKVTLVDDVDYAAYLANNVFNKSYMTKGDATLRQVEVFTLPESEDGTALYVFTEDGFVVSAKLDEFNGSFEPNFDYHAYVMFFPEAKDFKVALDKLAIDEADLVKSSENLTQEFEGKNAMDLLAVIEVMNPEVSYEDVATQDAYAVYTVANPASTDDENRDYQLGVYMDKDGMIKSIDVVKTTEKMSVPFLQ